MRDKGVGTAAGTGSDGFYPSAGAIRVVKCRGCRRLEVARCRCRCRWKIACINYSATNGGACFCWARARARVSGPIAYLKVSKPALEYINMN